MTHGTHGDGLSASQYPQPWPEVVNGTSNDASDDRREECQM